MQPPLRSISALPSASSPPRSRAARTWSWADPLRPLHRRSTRLARACLRCAALGALTAGYLFVIGARRGASPGWWALSAALAVLTLPLLLCAGKATRRAHEVEREIAERETEAERHLDVAS